jgi:hypothetical protein
LDQITSELKSLSDCEFQWLGKELHDLERILRRVQQGLQSKSERLEIYLHPWDGKTTEETRGYSIAGSNAWDPEVHLNGNDNSTVKATTGGTSPTFDSATNNQLAGLLLHEISHIYGWSMSHAKNWQGPLDPPFRDANVLEELVTRDLTGWDAYMTIKRKASACCDRSLRPGKGDSIYDDGLWDRMNSIDRKAGLR